MSNKSKHAEKKKKKNPTPIYIAVFVMLLAVLAVFVAKNSVKSKSETDNNKSENSSSVVSSKTEGEKQDEKEPEGPQMVKRGEYELDANYTDLLLVNAQKPLPKDHDYEKDLITIDAKYKNGQLDKINKNVWPYMKAMIEAAWADGVDLKVWSPFRSYETQNMLFENQVKRCMNKGLNREAAEIEAATVVARPGTSEHNTGLASDFNMADDRFETTEMYKWMEKHAAEYGFVMRYSAEKQSLTGVIHESWHWRFVGINTAEKMNKLGMCLEEYVEYLGE